MTELLEPASTATGTSGMVDDRPDDGYFRVDRAALVDDAVFAEEQRTIFDKCWLYVGHTSEVGNPGDFRARTVAGRPLVLWRGTDGEVRVFLNACRHRGAQLCRVPEGNARGMSCFYHAWTYSNDGRLTGLPDAEGYGPSFDRARFGLNSPPRVDVYRGFIFCCFDPDAIELPDYLGEARDYLDLVADQSPEMEVVEGMHEYSMEANWKLFVENSLDGYHLIPLHRTYFDYLKSTEDSYLDPRKPTEARDLGNGHAVITVEGPWARPVARWTPAMGEENREYIEAQRAELENRFDAERARRIATTDRNLLVFPNLVVNDIMALTVRTYFPMAPDYMVINAWALAPNDETAWARKYRLNNFLEFLGPGGFATPDDAEALEHCQRGFKNSKEAMWNDISKGMGKDKPSHNDELQMRAFWTQWNRQMFPTPIPSIKDVAA